jgi:hypothetical protein
MAFSAKIDGDELVLRIPMNAKPERSAMTRWKGVARERFRPGRVWGGFIQALSVSDGILCCRASYKP